MADKALAMPSNTFDTLSRLNVIRQIGIMIGLAASIAIGFGVILWSKEPTYRTLYQDLNQVDSSAIIGILQQENIKYQIDTEHGVLLVDADKIHDARLKLASMGHGSSSYGGYELLDQQQNIGTSQFMEKARYHRSIEGELARTISSISSVRSARVHIAIPRATVFVGDNQQARASVLIDLYPGQTLRKEQIAGIIQLIATSVPNLQDNQISIVDQKGNLLSDHKSSEHFMLAAKQLEYTREFEKGLTGRVNAILHPLIGDKNFSAQVSADIDFTVTEEADESYNPKSSVVRSEASLTESKGASELGGVPGALTNQPAATAESPEVAINPGQAADIENANQSSQGAGRKQLTRNYEIDRKIVHSKGQPGKVERLSVAVVLNNNPDMLPEGIAISEEMITNINQLIKDAIGFREDRGDSVTVSSQTFMKPVEEIIEEIPISMLEKPWVIDLGKMLIAAIAVLAIVFGFIKPLIRSLMQSTPTNKTGGMVVKDANGRIISDASGNSPNLKSGFGPSMGLGVDGDALLPSAGGTFEAQIGAIKTMVSEDPKRVAQVIKNWLQSESQKS
ncbi:MAG: flagellar basal-body MS-ring/collar protein FliF [Pseudomonadota bacterium]